MEPSSLLLGAALVLGVLGFSLRSRQRGGTAVVAGASILAAVALSADDRVLRQAQGAPPDDRPARSPDDGYVSSDRCRACHPDQHASWHASYHRRMTQEVRPETVLARHPLDSEAWGGSYRMSQEGDTFWAELSDPEWPGTAADAPIVRRQVVMATGSHHMQVYWYATGRGRSLTALPFAWLGEEEAWVPRPSLFLQPTPHEVPSWSGRWNRICINCHTTQPRMRLDEGEVDSRVGEFGISCEACHGPGEEHVRANSDPRRRYRLHLSGEPDPTIFDPASASKQASADVCGQCHGIWDFDDARLERTIAHGFEYRPGDRLADTRLVIRPGAMEDGERWREMLREDPHYVEDRFWSDGMVRVSGREYNGLIETPCFQRGELTCLSCHAMHQPAGDGRPREEWAADQLAEGMDGDAACLGCHAGLGEAHSRHAPGSSGAACMNCHMPYTTYGLLKAIRSHQISSPSVQESLATGRPNACNLCHLDRSLGWSATHLERWFGIPAPPLGHEEESVAASLLWLLRGDAGQRALVSWSMGWEPARKASGSEWMAPFLALLLQDAYEAVRFVAFRSLRSLPGFEGLEHDFLATPRERRAAALAALQRWRSEALPIAPAVRERLLLDARGDLAPAVGGLMARRDDRRVVLQE